MAERPRILIVEARFYAELADLMIEGASRELADAEVTKWPVPGCFELPAAIRMAIEGAGTGSCPRFDGYIALGSVVRGETDHYDHICRETSRALMDLTITHGIALGFGVLTCETYEQARVRAAIDGKNKGADAARACLRMMALRQSLRLPAR